MTREINKSINKLRKIQKNSVLTKDILHLIIIYLLYYVYPIFDFGRISTFRLFDSTPSTKDVIKRLFC